MGGPTVPFMEITSGTWMKLAAHVSVNPIKAQDAAHTVEGG